MTEQQFALAFEKGFNRTIQFLMSEGVPAEYAEEAAQAGWVKGWERRHQLRDSEKIGSWVNRISLNVFRHSLRRRFPASELVDPILLPGTNAATLDIQRGLGACNPTDQQLLRAYYLGGYTSVEMSRAWDCTPEAIRVRVFRAKRRLIDYLAIRKSSTVLTSPDCRTIARSHASGDSRRAMIRPSQSRSAPASDLTAIS